MEFSDEFKRAERQQMDCVTPDDKTANLNNHNYPQILSYKRPAAGMTTLASAQHFGAQSALDHQVVGQADLGSQLFNSSDEFIPVVSGVGEDNESVIVSGGNCNDRTRNQEYLINKGGRRASSLMCDAFDFEAAAHDENHDDDNQNQELNQFFQTEQPFELKDYPNFSEATGQNNLMPGGYQCQEAPNWANEHNEQLESDVYTVGDGGQREAMQELRQERYDYDEYYHAIDVNNNYAQINGQLQGVNSTRPPASDDDELGVKRIKVDRVERIHVDNTNVILGPGSTIHYTVRANPSADSISTQSPFEGSEYNHPMQFDHNNNTNLSYAQQTADQSPERQAYEYDKQQFEVSQQYYAPEGNNLYQNTIHHYPEELTYSQSYVSSNVDYNNDSGKTYHLMENQSSQPRHHHQQQIYPIGTGPYYGSDCYDQSSNLYASNATSMVSACYDPNVEIPNLLKCQQQVMVDHSDDEDQADGAATKVDGPVSSRRQGVYRKPSSYGKSSGYCERGQACRPETIKKLRTYLEMKRARALDSLNSSPSSSSSTYVLNNRQPDNQVYQMYAGSSKQPEEHAFYESYAPYSAEDGSFSSAAADPVDDTSISQVDSVDAGVRTGEDDVLTENRQLRSRTIIISSRKNSNDSVSPTNNNTGYNNNGYNNSCSNSGIQTRSSKKRRLDDYGEPFDQVNSYGRSLLRQAE